MREPSNVEARALAASWGAIASIVSYATLRFVEIGLGHATDPTVQLVPGPIAFFWRASTAIFGGVLFAFPALLLARRFPSVIARALAPALVASVAVLVLQALVAP